MVILGRNCSKFIILDTICSVIQNRLDNNNEPDDPLKGCWSCLWNVTDETPSNSERFIENGGVELFLKCLKKFPNDTDLKRNIMGLVGNIAEVASLRKYLIRDETVRFYSEALQSEGLEVAYNACGTLSHILSDESSTWPESLLEMKKDMTQKMIQAVESWDESAERNINYRSLKARIFQSSFARRTSPRFIIVPGETLDCYIWFRVETHHNSWYWV